MKLTFQKVSLNRILQQIYAKKIYAENRIIEFGAYENSKKNIKNIINIKDKKNIIYADKAHNDKDKTFKEDLEGKLSFKDDSFIT